MEDNTCVIVPEVDICPLSPSQSDSETEETKEEQPAPTPTRLTLSAVVSGNEPVGVGVEPDPEQPQTKKKKYRPVTAKVYEHLAKIRPKAQAKCRENHRKTKEYDKMREENERLQKMMDMIIDSREVKKTQEVQTLAPIKPEVLPIEEVPPRLLFGLNKTDGKANKPRTGFHFAKK